MKNIKIKIQQRSVYHKTTEVEIEVDADVYEHYQIENGKWTGMDDYLMDNEHLWVDKIDESISNADYIFGNGIDIDNDFTDKDAESETRWVWEEKTETGQKYLKGGGHL